jgi:hypothetical protein
MIVVAFVVGMVKYRIEIVRFEIGLRVEVSLVADR